MFDLPVLRELTTYPHVAQLPQHEETVGEKLKRLQLDGWTLKRVKTVEIVRFDPHTNLYWNSWSGPIYKLRFLFVLEHTDTQTELVKVGFFYDTPTEFVKGGFLYDTPEQLMEWKENENSNNQTN